MRQCYDDITSKDEKSIAFGASKYADELHERFEEQKMYKKFVDLIYKEEAFEIDEWLNELESEVAEYE